MRISVTGTVQLYHLPYDSLSLLPLLGHLLANLDNATDYFIVMVSNLTLGATVSNKTNKTKQTKQT